MIHPENNAHETVEWILLLLLLFIFGFIRCEYTYTTPAHGALQMYIPPGVCVCMCAGVELRVLQSTTDSGIKTLSTSTDNSVGRIFLYRYYRKRWLRN